MAGHAHLEPDGAGRLRRGVGGDRRLSGAALGGVLAGLGGIRLITIADAITFLVAAVLLILIKFRATRTRETAPRRHVLREWRAGLRIAVSKRTLRILLVFALITGVGEAIMSTSMVPFVRDVLHGGPGAYGNIMAVQAIGGLAGGAVTTLIARRIRRDCCSAAELWRSVCWTWCCSCIP